MIVGMDHDEEALRYLNDGVIYCLGVQDCYSIGFDTIQTAGNMKFLSGESEETLSYVPIEGTDWEMAVLIRDSVI